jgi:sugar phosphate isomerase/epimerase
VFGISTHLTVDQRLDRDHLVEIAAHGFEAVEVFAARTHFDYGDRRAVLALAEWLDDTRLTLTSMHAPIAAGYAKGAWQEPFSLAAADETRRLKAVNETLATLDVAVEVPYRFLVVHAGTAAPPGTPADNNRAAFNRSLETLAAAAGRLGVRLALEVIPNALSAPSALVQLLDEAEEWPGLGVCLDVGHARLMGDPVDAIETCSGHVLTTHLHDNRGKSDDHLVPGQGAVDWEGTLLAFQKVGYDGPWMFELAVAADPRASLVKAAKARERFEALLSFDDMTEGQ